MSTSTLPYPAQLERELKYKLPREVYGIHVIPRDETGRKCAAWRADFYEVKARLVHTPLPGELDPVEDALKAIPGVYRTTQEACAVAGDPVTGAGALPARVLDPDWPVKRRFDNPWTTP